jgi:cytochrome bd-type quinol oxidase subunit 2
MKTKLLIFLIAFLIGVVIGLPVLAAGLGSAGSVFKQIGSQAGADAYQTPQDLIGVGINAALTLVGLFFLVLMIYAGYLWLTARGEEEPINKAKKIIASSIIGFVLVASAYSITVFVGKRFEQSGGGGGEKADACTEKHPEWSCRSITTCEFSSDMGNTLPDDLVTACGDPVTNCEKDLCSGDKYNVCCEGAGGPKDE